ALNPFADFGGKGGASKRRVRLEPPAELAGQLSEEANLAEVAAAGPAIEGMQRQGSAVGVGEFVVERFRRQVGEVPAGQVEESPERSQPLHRRTRPFRDWSYVRTSGSRGIASTATGHDGAVSRDWRERARGHGGSPRRPRRRPRGGKTAVRAPG